MHFTEALIRACKHQLSGRQVDYAWVISQIAQVDSKYITDNDVRDHFATAIMQLAQVPPTLASRPLHDLVKASLTSPDRFREAVALLGLTRVDDLRKIGLWSDIEATATTTPTSALPPTTATAMEPNICP